MSNWEAKTLDVRQIAYAAVDALVCGHLLRSLRRWHASPCACSACQQRIGFPSDLPSGFTCTCGKAFSSFDGLQHHVTATGHAATFARCGECGRVRAVASCTAQQAGSTPGTELPPPLRPAAGSGAAQLVEERCPQGTAPCLARQQNAAEAGREVVRGERVAGAQAGPFPHPGSPTGAGVRKEAGSKRSWASCAAPGRSVREGLNRKAGKKAGRKGVFIGWSSG